MRISAWTPEFLLQYTMAGKSGPCGTVLQTFELEVVLWPSGKKWTLAASLLSG